MNLPPLQFSMPSAARGGTALSPWYQGDVVVSYAAAATSGNRTAPPPVGALTVDGPVTSGGAITATSAPGALGGRELWIAAAIVGGALLWKLSR